MGFGGVALQYLLPKIEDTDVLPRPFVVRNEREDISMLIQFSVSNFLSFNEKETFSMIAGKARKNVVHTSTN